MNKEYNNDERNPLDNIASIDDIFPKPTVKSGEKQDNKEREEITSQTNDNFNKSADTPSSPSDQPPAEKTVDPPTSTFDPSESFVPPSSSSHIQNEEPQNTSAWGTIPVPEEKNEASFSTEPSTFQSADNPTGDLNQDFNTSTEEGFSAEQPTTPYDYNAPSYQTNQTQSSEPTPSFSQDTNANETWGQYNKPPVSPTNTPYEQDGYYNYNTDTNYDPSYGQQASPSDGTYHYTGSQLSNITEQTDNQPVDSNYYSFQNTNEKNTGGTAVKKPKGLIIFSVIMCILFLTSVVVLGVYLANDNGSSTMNNGDNSGMVINSTPENSTTPTSSGEKLETVQIAQKVTPSVVGIVVYSQNNSSAVGEGSGVIMTSDGYIVSNAHVFVNSDTQQTYSHIKVVLNDESEYDATLVGIDTATDLAVIKIEAQNLTPAEFGDSTKLQVGENVVAIGNPTGLTLASSLTKGIVSGVDRAIGTGYATTFIQTDAAINPGNSGGALVNEYGQVIGINSSKIADTNYEGLGFAIPISEAQPIVNSLMNNGYVKDRVKIGIYYRVLDETTASMNGYPSGLYIEEVDQNYDIAKQGVRKGDIITAVDGEAITSSEQMIAFLKEKRPGDVISLDIYRTTSTNDQTFTVEITLEEDKGSVTS